MNRYEPQAHPEHEPRRYTCDCGNRLPCRHCEPQPIRPRSHDGIYPRCVWCNGENYTLAVLAYSRGEIPCTAAGGCGRKLPADYVTAGRGRWVVSG